MFDQVVMRCRCRVVWLENTLHATNTKLTVNSDELDVLEGSQHSIDAITVQGFASYYRGCSHPFIQSSSHASGGSRAAASKWRNPCWETSEKFVWDMLGCAEIALRKMVQPVGIIDNHR